MTMGRRNIAKTVLLVIIVGTVGVMVGAAIWESYDQHKERVQFEAHMLSGANALREGNLEDAKFHWHVAISLDETRYSPFFNLAEVYVRENRPELAVLMFEEATNRTSYRQIGIQGRIDDAIIQADRNRIQDELAKLKAKTGGQKR